ncbi:Clp protease N-terminal domain-containing protein [Longispora albida]|uniref:Clp protease N-terminal domain-containing protein n=1 Tax=Longispora albida TaxID=203523 RepID=UPI0003790800|nr:Clp protease N-terminal domain-containing protein [Longispora albida]
MTHPIRLDDLIEAIKKTSADSLDQLSSAVIAADHLGDVADHLIGHFVDQARRSGASWTDIGRSMGVTKQAAQKRFVPPKAPGEDLASQGFARFTERARSVVVAAMHEARQAGNAEIGTTHLVLGLLAEPESLAGMAIVAQGVTVGAVRDAATATLPATVDDVPDLIPYDMQARKALELTFREALRLGHNYVGTEHILLALLELEDGEGPLSTAGLTKASVEDSVLLALDSLKLPGT